MITGQIPQQNRWNSNFCWYGAQFSRESEFVTYVTVVRSTAMYHATMVQARLFTFYDSDGIRGKGIAYVDQVMSCEHTDYFNEEISEELSFVIPREFLEVMAPPGISELRDPSTDSTVPLFEVFICVRECMLSVKVTRPLALALNALDLGHNGVPDDVVKAICGFAQENASKHTKLQDAISKPVMWPFKVQHKDFWSKRPKYRIVNKNGHGHGRLFSGLGGWFDF
jgi:hypothetical protein